MGDVQMLHVERKGGGSFLLTVAEGAWLDDVTQWLWADQTPAGTNVEQGDVMLGYTTFVVTGLHNDQMQYMNNVAMQWLMYAEPESYRDYQARRDQEAADREEWMASKVPYLNGPTFREVWENWVEWSGLHEGSGYFVWMGPDPSDGRSVIQTYPMVDGTDSGGFNANVRWYIANEHLSLYAATQKELQAEWDAMAMAVIFMGH